MSAQNDSWKPSGASVNSLLPFRQLVLHDVGDDPRRWELGLEVGQVLTLVRSETGDVDEADDVVSVAGRRDDRSAIRMTDEQDRPVDLGDHSVRAQAVASMPTGRLTTPRGRHARRAACLTADGKRDRVQLRHRRRPHQDDLVASGRGDDDFA
jgi:hypothetical protein